MLKPRIIVILINDQHHHSVLGCAGFGPLETPAIDRLASEGTRFTQATCAITPCLPSRHALFHGQYACQTGMYSNNSCMYPETIPALTMGCAFKEGGYRTAAFGKMHWFPYWAKVERGNYFGFDERVGHFHETGELMQGHFVEAHRDWAEAYYMEWEEHKIDKGGDGCAEAFLGYHSQLPLSKFMDWYSAERAEQFIEENREKPFLLVVSLLGPHAPHCVPSDFTDLYRAADAPLPPEPPDHLPDRDAYQNLAGMNREQVSTAIANYMAYVRAMDECHNRVLKALDRNGLYDDSLIVFTSDHGELLGARGPAAFSKYNLYDPAIRIPLVIKPPLGNDRSPVGNICKFPVSLVDLLPTLMSMSELPDHENLPGIDLSPALDNKPLGQERQVTITELARQGNHYFALRNGEWKYIQGPHGEELYHLRKDPWEFENLVGVSTFKDRLNELKNAMIKEFSAMGKAKESSRTIRENQEWGPLIL